ncbi:DUF1183-domain-containing protein [Neolentinus lepideus HHB14362 ss-1]|uniref:Store-operated calcium entry-associated regulatory factor n=1 Tax=Neolentinus lepideus HHB14362 ss-1 TaxID=1314782 RepID=A0A165Q6J9_9AGAM|nr:DUF1183-domain-containing protein [Neolentinus lepideus HHB14362 ss-1]
MSRVALATIPALTFYKDELTAARRSAPVQQLTCLGKACHLYTPDVVRCTNLGGSGTDVDWKCEADLPESLRFGRVQVSCEGWEGPGDAYVLKGSCGLEYRLVEVPGALRTDKHAIRQLSTRLTRWWNDANVGNIIFMILWTAILLFILYHLLKSCLGDRSARNTRPGSTGNFFYPSRPNNRGPGGPHHPHDPPPPYSKTPPQPPAGDAHSRGWSDSGHFWTGAVLGGLATEMYNRARNSNANNRAQRDRQYDWERERAGGRGGFGDQQQRYAEPVFSSPRRPSSSFSNFEDRGEGSSSGLGPLRRSTGYGGSSVR